MTRERVSLLETNMISIKWLASDRASILQVIEGNKIGWFVYEQHQFKPIK